MPTVVSVFGAGLFIITAAIGGVMTLRQATIPLGKTILVYSFFCSWLGLACCWLAYAALRLVWSWDGLSIRLGNVDVFLPMTLFCVSGPFGVAIGVFLAGRSLRAGRGHASGPSARSECLFGGASAVAAGTLWMFMARGLNGKSAGGGLIAAAGVALFLVGVRLKRPHPGANPSADVSPPEDREPPDPDEVRTIVRRS